MSCYSGPKISNNGLVFHYDMGNTQKSWKGAPTTNLLGNPFCLNNTGPTSVAYTNYEATTTIVPAFNSAMSEISPYWIKFVKNSATNGRVWFLGLSNLTIGVDYTYSAYVYTEDSNLTSAYLGSDNTGVSYNTSNLLTWSTANKGSVRRIASVFRSLNGSQVQGCRVNSGDPIGTTFYMAAFQCEQASIASPVVDGSRTTSQAILDLTKTNTITIGNLTYSSNNTFSFDGTDDILTTATLPYQFLTTGVTISTAFRYTQTTTNDNLISWGNSAFNQVLSYSWEIRLRGSGAVEFAPGVYTTGTAPARMTYVPSPALNGRDVILDVVYTANGVSYIYENGTQVSTYDYTGVGTYSNTQALRIGRGTDTYFPGKIYFVKLYNKPLTAAEIKQNFEATRDRFGI